MKNRSQDLSQPELMILKSLQSGRRRYGLEIRSVVETYFKRRFNFSTLYPKLDLLEAKGYITSEEDEDVLKKRARSKRRYFTITGEGSKALSDWEAAFNAMKDYEFSEESSVVGALA